MCEYCRMTKDEKALYGVKFLGDLKADDQNQSPVNLYMTWKRDEDRPEETSAWLRVVRTKWEGLEEVASDKIVVPIAYCPFCGEKL